MMTNSNNDWVHQKSVNEKSFIARSETCQKKIKRSIENNLNRNEYTVTSNGTFQMFHITINKI